MPQLCKDRPVDVCLILEGTYPYVAGGVSTWTHDLIRSQPDLSFFLVTLLPSHEKRKPRYELPENVVGIEHTYVQEMTKGERQIVHMDRFFADLESPLERLQSRRGNLADLAEVFELIYPLREQLGGRVLLNSEPSWEMMLRMYGRGHPDSSFLDYFWSWRALMGGLFSILLSDIPAARLYHTASTGYAGILSARAVLETGRPGIVTEHGIYTNERRIEIAMADWLFEDERADLNVDRSKRDLKDLWMDTFSSYSRCCYQACGDIVTLYEGNQHLQVDDGADRSRMAIIPNGIDYERYSVIERRPYPGAEGAPPTLGFVGRVVPIKDVKTLIRACGMMRKDIPDLRVLVIGPYDEDEEYYEECCEMVADLELGRVIEFMGRQRLDDVLPEVDVMVLTSISEGMPLVILECGAAGIPSVATDVGACRELIMGSTSETPSLGAGGIVTPLSNPRATAEACIRLLTDTDRYLSASESIKTRVERFYNKTGQDAAYRALYDRRMTAETRPTPLPRPSHLAEAAE